VTSINRIVPAALIAVTLASAACAPQAATPAPPPSASASVIAFQGTVPAAALTLATQGFSCDPDPASPLPTRGSALDRIYTKICRKPAPGGQGTFIYLYGLRVGGSIVGIDIATDQAGSAGASSPEVTSAIALVFPASAAAAVQKTAADTIAAGYGTTRSLSPAVQVANRSQNGQVVVEIWGPEVVAGAASIK
jgi:hypothetical protein